MNSVVKEDVIHTNKDIAMVETKSFIWWIIDIIAVSIGITLFDFNDFLMGNKHPSQLKGISSIIFVLMWGIYGFVAGYGKSIIFKKFVSLYFGIGLVITIISYSLGAIILAILPILLLVGPLYGFNYFFDMPTDLKEAAIFIIITYIVIMIANLSGNSLKNYDDANPTKTNTYDNF